LSSSCAVIKHDNLKLTFQTWLCFSLNFFHFESFVKDFDGSSIRKHLSFQFKFCMLSCYMIPLGNLGDFSVEYFHRKLVNKLQTTKLPTRLHIYLRSKLHGVSCQNIARFPYRIINELDVSIQNVASHMFYQASQV
jgi:hypothetical protein